MAEDQPGLPGTSNHDHRPGQQPTQPLGGPRPATPARLRPARKRVALTDPNRAVARRLLGAASLRGGRATPRGPSRLLAALGCRVPGLDPDRDPRRRHRRAVRCRNPYAALGRRWCQPPVPGGAWPVHSGRAGLLHLLPRHLRRPIDGQQDHGDPGAGADTGRSLPYARAFARALMSSLSALPCLLWVLLDVVGTPQGDLARHRRRQPGSQGQRLPARRVQPPCLLSAGRGLPSDRNRHAGVILWFCRG
jgi:hypothetical protein